MSSDHETTGQLSVVSGQRFAGSNCGASEQGSSVSSWGLPPSAAPRLRSAWSAAAGKFVAGKLGQRGAACFGSFCTKISCPSGTLHAVPLPHAVLPNPSFKPSPDGVSRGPGRRNAVHFRQPGPRVPPSVPA